jgi:hypothetical protein
LFVAGFETLCNIRPFVKSKGNISIGTTNSRKNNTETTLSNRIMSLDDFNTKGKVNYLKKRKRISPLLASCGTLSFIMLLLFVIAVVEP